MASTTMYTQTDFKVLPDEEQLHQLDRALRFHPVTTAEPDVLSLAEIERYNREGYLKAIGFLTRMKLTTYATISTRCWSRCWLKAATPIR